MKTNPNITEPRPLQWLLIGIALLFLAVMLVIPLTAVFAEALKGGWRLYLASLSDPEALSAIKLTLLTAAIVVPVNAVLGVAMAWLLTRFDFRGKQLLTTLLDLPFSVSPVVAGLMFVLLFGAHTALGGWLEAHGIQIIFAVPGIILATLFVTFPFVAREIAVSVVSGHIRGETNTIPLLVEIFYNEYNFVGAFALSSILALLAIATLAIQDILTKIQRKKHRAAEREAA